VIALLLALSFVFSLGPSTLYHDDWGGGEGRAKFLLELKEVNPESGDNYGRTPLSLALETGVRGQSSCLWSDAMPI